MRQHKSSWQEPFDIHELVSHIDPRGFLIELLRFVDNGIPGRGQLYTISIEPGKRRGDHYHHRKREWFIGVHGKTTMLLTAPDGRSRSYELSPDKPAVVYAGAGTTHAMLNRTDELAVLVIYASEQHEDNSDTVMKMAFEDYDPRADDA